MSTAAIDLRQELLARPAQGNHFVLFYEDEDVLNEFVAKFLGNGLAAREPVVIIGRADCIRAFRDALEKESCDVASALASGHLRMLDADETLALFMRDGRPDADLFVGVLGAVISEVREKFPDGRVRAYNEMVDVLCSEGNGEGAIQVEELWNELAKQHSFALFCAYVMDSFAGIKNADLYGRICDAHTHAFPAAIESETHTRLRAVADLQHRARVLEAEIERSKQSDMFRLLVESVQDYAIFVLDPQGMVQTWNAGAQRIKGYAAHEIVGQHFSRFYAQEDIDAGKCELELAGATRDGRFEDESWRMRKDGTRFWANVVITALLDPAGKLIGFAKVTRDLTERRKAEQERAIAEQQRLEFAKNEERNRIKDQFLATLSHELRTPLNAIFGWASLLKSAQNMADVDRAAETIQRNAEAQIRIVDDMLDLSRIITGKMRIDVRVVDLADILRDALEVVRPAADAKGVELVARIPEQPTKFVGDPVRLQQTAWNFLSNAVKFSSAGGTITAALRQEGATVELEVADTGQGIERDFLPHVFEPFRQADSGPTRRVGGVGLGLAIVKHIVEVHGGTVSVSSEGLGKGTSFRATLPVRAAVPVQDSNARRVRENVVKTPRDGLNLDGVRVLVVDDDPDARYILSVLFKSRAAIIYLAESASEARRALSSFDPHVIVSDIAMPDEDGLQFLRGVRALPMAAGGMTPAIALTAYAYAEDRRRALEAGYNYHLAKPVNHDELIGAIHNLVNFAGKHSEKSPPGRLNGSSTTSP